MSDVSGLRPTDQIRADVDDWPTRGKSREGYSYGRVFRHDVIALLAEVERLRAENKTLLAFHCASCDGRCSE